MTDRSENIYSQRNKALEILFAVLLLLLPLLKINQGVDPRTALETIVSLKEQTVCGCSRPSFPT